ncbi:MAG: ABC transporter substrate-binding protein [Candidatus Heimdallarchaeota archaeon]|nr:ABC transporter substrate-binding protein [Candidatus Heimdallarchaeota archaeon]
MSLTPLDNSIGGLNSNQNGNTLTYAMPYDFSEYSVYTANSYASAQWQSTIMNGLYKRSSTAELNWVPDLAASLPIISDDKKTFTIQLKPDLVFSDGSELSVDDVIFSFRVAMTPAINTNFYDEFVGLMNNESVTRSPTDTVIDEYIIHITMLESAPFPFSLLATPLIPEETFGELYNSCVDGTDADCIWDDKDLSFVIGAGPYKASSYDATRQVITVIKNDNYYGWADGSATGNIDTIVFKKTSEKAAVIAELVDGTIDIMDSQYIPGLDELSLFAGITEGFVVNPAHQEISLNHLHPMYGTGKGLPGMASATDVDAWAAALKVRTAMSHIVDREFAANEISDGLAQPAATPMPASLLGWDPTLIPLAFDITASKALMEEVGFDYSTLKDMDNDGVYETSFFNITVLSPNTGVARNGWNAGYVIELPKIGIGVKEHVSTGWAEIIPRTFGWSGTGESLVPLYDEEGYDILFVGYGWSFDYNPQGLYDATGRHDTTGGGNFYNFDVDEIQTDMGTLVQDYLSEFDFTKRIQKVKLVQAELYKFKPVLPILLPLSHWGYRNDIAHINLPLLSISSVEWELLTKGSVNLESEGPALLTIFITVPGNTTTVRAQAKSTTFETPLSPWFTSSLIFVIINRKRKPTIVEELVY